MELLLRRAALAILLLPGAAAAGGVSVVEYKPGKLERIRAVLDYAIWNPRVSAVYDLGEMRSPKALPHLIYADDDADWQVRLAAVHFLGKAGPGAADALYEVARREPCPHVRLLALRGLSRMGKRGERLFKEVLTPEDEDALGHLPDGTPGRPVVIDSPQGDMTPEFFNGEFTDPRVCASSERAGRLHEHLKWPRGKERKQWSNEIVVTPEVTVGRDLKKEAFEREEKEYARREAALTPKEKARNAELDALFAAKTEKRKGAPESLPKAGKGFDERVVERGSVAYAKTERKAVRAAAPEKPLEKPDFKAETMPAAPAGISHEGPESGKAEVVADKGTGKEEFDPVPELMRRLRYSGEPRTRARAADELGKRGTAAARAAGPLREALRDKDKRVRASAALALGSVGGAEAAKDLRRALRDKDEDVRFSAGVALARLAGPKNGP